MVRGANHTVSFGNCPVPVGNCGRISAESEILSPVTESGEYENPIKGVSFGKGPLDAGLFQ